MGKQPRGWFGAFGQRRPQLAGVLAATVVAAGGSALYELVHELAGRPRLIGFHAWVAVLWFVAIGGFAHGAGDGQVWRERDDKLRVRGGRWSARTGAQMIAATVALYAGGLIAALLW